MNKHVCLSPLHVLDALPELNVVVVPRDGGGGEADDPASEPGRVPLHGERGLGLDNEARGGALAVNQNLLHAVLLHLELAQRAELGKSAQGQDELVPVGVFLADLLTDGKEPVTGNLQRLVRVVACENQKRCHQLLSRHNA